MYRVQERAPPGALESSHFTVGRGPVKKNQKEISNRKDLQFAGIRRPEKVERRQINGSNSFSSPEQESDAAARIPAGPDDPSGRFRLKVTR